MKLKELTDEQLAVCLLDSVRNSYDLGGISSGRSFYSVFVDASRAMMPSNFSLDEEISNDDLMKEVKSRKKDFPNQGLLFTELKFIPDYVLAMAMLNLVKDKYAADKDKEDSIGNFGEDRIDAVLQLLPQLPYNLPKYDSKRLRDEADERHRKDNQDRDRKRDAIQNYLTQNELFAEKFDEFWYF